MPSVTFAAVDSAPVVSAPVGVAAIAPPRPPPCVVSARVGSAPVAVAFCLSFSVHPPQSVNKYPDKKRAPGTPEPVIKTNQKIQPLGLEPGGAETLERQRRRNA
jgi:hypothetical protein